MISFALLLFAAIAPAPQPAQSFRLESGDFRWIPFTVRQTPTGVDCRFEVVSGGPTVHTELLPMSEFRRFDRGREHETMAATPKSRTGAFRRVINTRGQYAIVVVNEKGAAPVTVSLSVETNANPDNADIATTLAPARQRTVILLSLAFFLVTVTWSGRKLIAAMRAGR
ncbi:MAG TPA: hypothetical protein VEF06_14900 [Bryobacteraceae bacterium]|nr:hypothetical protein [Bryobacteraceae bacterium]